MGRQLDLARTTLKHFSHSPEATRNSAAITQKQLANVSEAILEASSLRVEDVAIWGLCWVLEDS